MSKSIIPNTELKAFSCPHCDAIADQTWYDALGDRLTEKDKLPIKIRHDFEEHLETLSEDELSQGARKEIILRAKRVLSGEVFFRGDEEHYYSIKLENLHFSKCFSCKKLSVWIAHTLAWPETKFEIQPSVDMPEIVKRDFEEAALIFKKSPRSAAALLRLAIEKLCNELNGTKASVFEGIGKLVKKGLDPKIQKALDIVRVTGNDAVHPGQINLNDTPEVAERLFKLVNVIVESLIAVPKEIDDIYDTISDGKKEAIQKRDKKE